MIAKAPLTAALLLVSLQSTAFAALGDTTESVAADAQRLHSVPVITAMQLYDRHDMVTAVGSVHEFVSRSGQVFAVTWRGELQPDLAQLLGSHFQSYRSALAAKSGPGAHHFAAIVQPDLVVHAVGRMRAFEGAAYVPSLVPVGFDLSELR